MNGYLRLRLMILAKKIRGTVEANESFKGKLVKTMEEEVSCCRTSCIYQGDKDEEQFVTKEIIEEWNRWQNIEVRTTWDRKIIRDASPDGGTIAVYEG
ncbi:hypothetical protein Tco_0959179 [Tanacetum coccineum]